MDDGAVVILCFFYVVFEQRAAFLSSWQLFVRRQLVDGMHLSTIATRRVLRREEVEVDRFVVPCSLETLRGVVPPQLQ